MTEGTYEFKLTDNTQECLSKMASTLRVDDPPRDGLRPTTLEHPHESAPHEDGLRPTTLELPTPHEVEHPPKLGEGILRELMEDVKEEIEDVKDEKSEVEREVVLNHPVPSCFKLKKKKPSEGGSNVTTYGVIGGIGLALMLLL